MSYDGLRIVAAADAPHLGGNLLEGDPHTFAPKVWDYVVNRFGIRSAMDLGAGLGYASEYFFRKGVRVIAVDGFVENVAKAIYPTVQIDITKSAVNCNVDLVYCQEVVEHIDPACLENLLTSLASGKFILMTHGLPGQQGHHHVNCQPQEYWVENLARYNCHLLVEDTMRVRKLAHDDAAHYIVQSGLVFANRNRF